MKVLPPGAQGDRQNNTHRVSSGVDNARKDTEKAVLREQVYREMRKGEACRAGTVSIFERDTGG